MTLRMKLACWVGGREWSAMLCRWTVDLENILSEKRDIEGMAVNQAQTIKKMHCTLKAIAALETPKANATVRNMARIAREAME